MQYRTFPRIPGVPVSTLGFGCMRLPTLAADGASRIDEDAATALLHEAIEAGVNYVDTAWPYHGGESEPFVGRALQGGWRDRVQVATKCPIWLVHEAGDWDRYLDQQRARLQTDCIDFYLVHALSGERWQQLRRLGGLEALERARAAGRIRHLGFSFHGTLDDFRTIIDGHPWDFTQIQLNYLDEHFQAGLDGLRYAADRGVGVIVMEPLRGGALAKPLPALDGVFGRSGHDWSPAEWALRWVLDQEGVTCVLSGMGAADQLRENVRVAGAAGRLDPGDLALIDEAKAVFRARIRVACTTCGYCLPCPEGVAIPDVLWLYNTARMFDSAEQPSFVYNHWLAGEGADKCTECATCETKCPQGLPIMEALAEAHACLKAGPG